MAKLDKEKRVEELADLLKRAKGLVLSDFTGLNVAEMTELRRRCRENQVSYLVVKNTLARFAATKAEMEDLVPHLTGPNGLTFSFEDPLVPAKVIHAFAQESNKLAIKAGVFGGGLLGPEEVKRIALLPGREILLSQLLSQMNAPVTGFVSGLKNMFTRLVYVLSQVKDVKKDDAETPVPEPKSDTEENQRVDSGEDDDNQAEELKKED